MTSRSSGEQRKALLQDIYQENLKLLGRPSPEPRKKTKRTAALLILSLMIGGLLFVGVGLEQMKQPVPDVPSEQFLSPEQKVRTSLNKIPDLEPDDKNPLLSSVYGLNVRTIAIDPGHGGYDPGAIGQADLTEKTLTLDLALRLERRLKAHGLNVILTRSQDINVSLRERVEYAKEQQADLFVSIHVNSLPVDTIAFIETFYFSPRADARIERLAAQENINSGYSFGQWQNDFEKINRTLKIEESRHLATYIQREMVSHMRKFNPNLQDWGARSGPFMVLMNAGVPAVLAEVTAISMPEEEQRLLNIEYREQLAIGLESGILAYISEKRNTQITTD
ncbi:MAG: N-acetylmuramoyl-L-alanine amidase [Bacteroidetes bacterium]|nr:N-acetylmuramoyl-L-alanine amidase [Bacteroidota bacterium]MCY4205221.1 N-acetylmuramoyl-L-alanine amidase [Bacteroidota bacterium]